MNCYRTHDRGPRLALFLSGLFLILLAPLWLWGQTNGAAVPEGHGLPAAAPAAASKIAMLLALGVPLLLAALKAAVPRLPGWSLPILAPVFGALGDYLLQKAGVSNLGPEWGAVLGAAGVGVRELKDQVHQRIGGVGGTAVMLFLLGAMGFVVGCVDLPTSVFRFEQTTGKLADNNMRGYAVWWKSQTNHADAATLKDLLQEREQVMSASRELEASLHTLENWRVVYTTNTAMAKAPLQAAWDATISQSSNIVWLIGELRNRPRFSVTPIQVPVYVLVATNQVPGATTNH
jgi:hypothetical protein